MPNIETILDNFVSKLPKPVLNDSIKNNPHITRSLVKDLPMCLLRVAKFHDGKLLVSCGVRRLTDTDSFDDLGCCLVMDECKKCGGYTSAMIIKDKGNTFKFKNYKKVDR